MARKYNPNRPKYAEKNYTYTQSKGIDIKGNFIIKNADSYFDWIYDRIDQREGEFLRSFGKEIESIGTTLKKGYNFQLNGYMKTVHFDINGLVSKTLTDLVESKRVTGRNYSHVYVNLHAESLAKLEQSNFINFLGLNKRELTAFINGILVQKHKKEKRKQKQRTARERAKR